MFDLVLSIAIFALIFDITLAVYIAKKAKVGQVMDKIDGYIAEWRDKGGLDQYVWQEENGEWRMDERIGKLIDFVGSRFALSVRQSMFQAMGVDQKLQKGVDKAFALDLMDNTGIGGILELLGMRNVKSILARNPKTLTMVLERAEPLISKFMKNQGQQFNQSQGGKM